MNCQALKIINQKNHCNVKQQWRNGTPLAGCLTAGGAPLLRLTPTPRKTRLVLTSLTYVAVHPIYSSGTQSIGKVRGAGGGGAVMDSAGE